MECVRTYPGTIRKEQDTVAFFFFEDIFLHTYCAASNRINKGEDTHALEYTCLHACCVRHWKYTVAFIELVLPHNCEVKE